METEFVTWLIAEMNKRGWSNSELARRAEIVPSAVSMVVSRQRGPGLEFCKGVARALKVPPDQVLRKAGLLPQLPDGAADTQQLLDYYKSLSSRAREEVTEYVAFKYEREQHDDRSIS